MNKPPRNAILDWWTDLDNHRGERAALRRCRTLKAAQDQPGTSRLLRALQHHKPTPGTEQAGAMAGLLSHVREDWEEAGSLGQQMAQSDAETGRPAVSLLRFERLLRHQTRQELYHPLIRILHLLDGKASVGKLANDLWDWGDGVRQQWARDYYRQHFAAEEVPDSTDVKVLTRAWWQRLEEHKDERAALRRCASLEEIQWQRGYHRLLRYVEGQEIYCARIALVAGILAHVKTDRVAAEDSPTSEAPVPKKGKREKSTAKEDQPPSLARQMAGETGASRAVVSGLRFRRLIALEDADDLYRPLVRIVQQLGRKADVKIDVAGLAEDLFYWSKEMCQQWAEDYFLNAPDKEP
jgi:CRISPR system Cascade subunit CasB